MKFEKLSNNEIGMNNKTSFTGNMFVIPPDREFDVYVNNIKDIINGLVTDEISDGKVIGRLTCIYEKERHLHGLDICLNYSNTKEIIKKHGMLDIDGLIMTVNIPDRILLVKGANGRDMLNLIKFAETGFQIVVAIRINGFAVVTHFERVVGDHQMTRRTQHYLDSIMNRGSEVYSSGKTADLPLIAENFLHPPSEP